MKRSYYFFYMLLLSMALSLCALADDPRLVLNTGGHTSHIRKIIFTRNGKYLISAGEDKVVRVWDVSTGRLARTIQGEIGDGVAGKIYGMALSPDERILAVGGWLAGDDSNSFAIRLHDFRTGAVVGLLKRHTDVINVVSFSPDGRYLASCGGDGTAYVWNLTAKQPTYPPLDGDTENIFALAFSPDSKRIATGDANGIVRLWDVVNGMLFRKLEKKHSDKVVNVAYSPDGRYLVSGGEDKKVLLWNAQTGDFVKELHRQETTVESLSFSPTGDRLLTGAGEESGSFVCYVLAFPSGAVVTRFGKHDNLVLATAMWSDGKGNGKLAATAGGNQKLIYLWNPENGQIMHTMAGQGQPVWAVGFARDSQSIAFGSQYAYKNVHQYGPLQRSITLLSNSDWRVTLGGAVKDEAAFTRGLSSMGEYTLNTTSDHDPTLVVQAGKFKRTITRDGSSGEVHRSYTLTNDGQQIASGGYSGVLKVYETKGKGEHDFVGHTGDVLALAVAPDNRTLVSGSDDQTVRLWDLESKEEETKPLLSIFVAQDNEWIAWTPQGYYTASLNGDRYIGWHVNHGLDKAADYYSAAQFKAQFYRPDVVNEYLRTRGNLKLALKTANERRGLQVTSETNSLVPNVLDLEPPVPYFIQPPEYDESIIETTNAIFTVKAAAKKAHTEAPDVAELTLLLNGKAFDPVASQRLEMQVKLDPNKNTLALIATNTKGIPSQPAVVKIDYKGKATKTIQKIMFLGIGMAKYQLPGYDLNYADQDALEIKKLFESQRNKSPFGEVLAEVYTNEQVNKDLILDKLDWLKKAESGDLVVIFLSGHGGLYEDDYYFYTYQHNKDADYERYDVNWRVLIRSLKVIKANVVLFLDTCHAGAVTGKAKGEDAFEKALRDLQQSNPGKMIFVSSRGNELSYELDGKEGRTHGAFTYALIQGLLGKADILDKDDIVYTNEIGPWLETEVPKLKPQNPQYTKPDNIPGFKHFPVFVINRR